MKSYVIGASGFLGSHVATWLEKSGVVRKAPAYDDAAPLEWQKSVLEDMRRFAPDLVLIPGASQATGDDAESIRTLIASNCVLPCLVAQQLLEHFPESKLVVFGTSWQFADSDAFRPFNLYAASKQAGQDLLTHYALRGLKILQLIVFDTYGEDDTRRKLLKLLQDACARGEELGTTPGEQEIDLVHIDDVCAGIECAVHDLQDWDSSQGILVLGLGSGKPIRVKELMSRVAERIGRPLRVNIGERAYRPREVMAAYRNYRRPTGWTPKRTEFHASFDIRDLDGDSTD
jgi:CDP-3, 6-dideoxy-D-glycero-L-glycero-4-hexulose-4-reductase